MKPNGTVLTVHATERQAAENARLDDAARLLMTVISVEGRYRSVGRMFLDAAEGLDHRLVVERAAEFLNEKLPKAEALRAVWHDVRRLFGWHDRGGSS